MGIKVKPSANRKLFDWVYQVVIEEGGDGDCVIGFKAQDYREVAKEFRKYFPPSWKMWERKDSVVFHDNQEYVVLTTVDCAQSMNEFPKILTW
jgi:hypothetical protein